jgi:two-component system, chemotaxis family, chemotaxis protein CheY
VASHTVLICDDTPYIRSLMHAILSRGGFEVIGEAQTGVEAVEQYKALRPDVVTMDIVMREMGGIDAVRAIRRFDERARILMCSALAPPALVAEALEAGAKEFVVKPFQPSRLLEAVQFVLT